MIWTGVAAEGVEPVSALQSRLRAALAQLELKTEERPFRPHLTLGRVRAGRNCANLVEKLTAMQAMEFGTVTVDRLKLMQSFLETQGARHQTLREAVFVG